MYSCKISNLTLLYNNIKILSDLNLDSFGTHCYGFSGPSGIGKSSLLNLLAGVSKAKIIGSIKWYYDSQLVTPPMPIGLVQQGSPIPDWMTVRDFLRMMSGNDAISTDEIAHILSQFQLEPKTVLSLFPHELSGGMKARVALAGAMNAGASVLLLDEPFAGIDEVIRHDLIEMLKIKLSEFQFTCFIVSHVFVEVMYLSDKVLYFKNPKKGIYNEIMGYNERVANISDLIRGDIGESIAEQYNYLSKIIYDS